MVEPIEPTGRAEPVPSLADAWALLLRSVAVQLRRLRPAPHPMRVAAPARLVADVRSDAAGRRYRMAPRAVLTCLLLLVAIFGATAALTWWSWQALQDRQVHLGEARDLRAEPEDRSLTGELVKREDRALEAAPARKEPGSAVLERPDAGLPKQSGGSVSLDGRIVAGALTTAALGGATLLSRVVLRRYRERALLAPGPDHRPSELEPEPRFVAVPEQLDGTQSPHELPQDALEPALTDADADVDVDAGSGTGLLVEQRQPPPEESWRTVAAEPTGLTAVSVSADPGESSTAERLELSGAEPAEPGSWAVQQPGPADADRYAATGEETARERIFDRRVSRRLPYTQPAWLWWADQNAPVTVQDVSLTGLRCLLSMSAGAPALPAPPLGEAVRIFFPVSGTTVKAAAQLQWREQTATGLQMGLEFVDLPLPARELLRELLLAES
jgi:hypothetical protein